MRIPLLFVVLAPFLAVAGLLEGASAAGPQDSSQAASSSARFKPPSGADPARYPKFTIVHSLSHGEADIAFQSRVEVGYRLSSQWEWRGMSAALQALLEEQGLSPRNVPGKGWIGATLTAGTPRDLFRLRGSILGMKSGERLQFYLASSDGDATGHEGTDGYVARVATVGDGLYRTTVQGPRGTSTDMNRDGRYTNISPSASVQAELIRTLKGAVLWFNAEHCPSAGTGGPFGTADVAVNVIPSDAQFRKVFTFTLTNQELATWEQIDRVNEALLVDTEESGTTLNYRAELRMTQPKDEVEVSVEPEKGYETWKPEGNVHEPGEPGNQLEVVVRVHAVGDPGTPRRATLDVSLPYVSEQKGVCVNWPKNAGVAKGLRFRAEDYPRGGPITWVDESHLRSTEAVEEVTVVVHAHDFGAWGTLRLTARDEGRDVPVKIRGREVPDLTIPLDDNGNRIADAWEKDENVEGYASTWDDAAAPGQRSRGDGLTLYEKYRGVVVLDPSHGRVYTRLDPREKSHFVIDPSNVFDFERWRRTTGVRAFRLDSSLVPGGKDLKPAAARRVDFNSDGKGKGSKFAVRIELVKGLVDPDPPPEDDGRPASGDQPSQWAYTSTSSGPGDAEMLRIFPDRMRGMIDRVIEKIRAGLDPATPDHERQSTFLDQTGIPRDEIVTRLANLDDQARQQLTDRMVALSAIHEMGHACAAHGHRNEAGDEDEAVQRVRSCPMQYLGKREKRLFVLLGELDGAGKLCSAAPDDCMGSVNVRN